MIAVSKPPPNLVRELDKQELQTDSIPRLGGFRVVPGLKPRLGFQRLQSPGQASLIATWIGESVLPRRFKLTTDRRASLINAA